MPKSERAVLYRFNLTAAVTLACCLRHMSDTEEQIPRLQQYSHCSGGRDWVHVCLLPVCSRVAQCGAWAAARLQPLRCAAATRWQRCQNDDPVSAWQADAQQTAEMWTCWVKRCINNNNTPSECIVYCKCVCVAEHFLCSTCADTGTLTAGLIVN